METTDLARKTVEIAHKDIGQRETDGNNNSPRIRQYLATVGLAPPNPYCASAVSTWVKEAAAELGIKPTFLRSGSALGLFHNNPTLRFTELTPSDIPCIGINEHADHIHGHAFLIVGLDEETGTLQTIDPNSDPKGSREGGGVWALNIRNTKDVERKGYVRIA